MGKKKTTKPRGKYEYTVMTNKKYQGRKYNIQMKGGKFTSKKKAEAFFKKHARATHIQRYTRKSGLSSGAYQPNAPSRIKVGKKTYRKAYLGPFRAREAARMAKDFKKRGMKIKIKKTKQGRHIYYR